MSNVRMPGVGQIIRAVEVSPNSEFAVLAHLHDEDPVVVELRTRLTVIEEALARLLSRTAPPPRTVDGHRDA